MYLYITFIKYINNIKDGVNMTNTCKYCGKKYSKKYKTTFCSIKCSSSYNKEHKKTGGDKSSLTYFISKYGEKEGRILYDKKKTKISESLKGKIPHNKGKRHSNIVKKKISNSVV